MIVRRAAHSGEQTSVSEETDDDRDSIGDSSRVHS